MQVVASLLTNKTTNSALLITMNTKTKETLGHRLRILRLKYHLSQTEFANHVGLKGHVGINKIENGETTKPQRDTINNIVTVFGTTHDWLLEGKGEMLPGGMKELTKTPGVPADPYRDYAIQRLEREVEKEEVAAKTWQEKYDQLWEMFSRVTAANFRNPVRRTA